MKQATIATQTLYSDPDSVIRQLKKFMGGRTTGTFEVQDLFGETCAGCERDARREWTEPDEHTCEIRRSYTVKLGVNGA